MAAGQLYEVIVWNAETQTSEWVQLTTGNGLTVSVDLAAQVIREGGDPEGDIRMIVVAPQ